MVRKNKGNGVYSLSIQREGILKKSLFAFLGFILILSVVGSFNGVVHANSANISDEALKKAINEQLVFDGMIIDIDNHDPTIDDLKSLTELDAYDYGIENLTGLEHATILEDLDLGKNDINDISALGSLTELEVLYLDDNKINDISALGSLTKLKELYLNDNHILDLSPLKDFFGNLVNGDLSNQIIELPEESLLDTDTELEIPNPVRDYNGNVFHYIDVDDGDYDNGIITWDGLTGSVGDTTYLTFTFFDDNSGFFGTVRQPIEWINITEVELAIPEFTEATCDNPEVGVETPEQEGVTFEVQGDIEEGGTIIVIAQPGDNVELIATEGWELDDGHGFYEHTFDTLGDCEEPEKVGIPLDTPDFTEATCDVPEVGVETPEQEGINFQVQGDVEEGGTVTVIAQPDEGVELIATEGWELDDGYGFYEHTFDTLGDCKEEKPTKPEPSEPEDGNDDDDGKKLPKTATNNFNMMAMGLGSLLLGAISYVFIRRRAL